MIIRRRHLDEIFEGWDMTIEAAKRLGEERNAALKAFADVLDTLRLIAETDPIDAVLDPDRARRVAHETLMRHRDFLATLAEKT